MIRQVEAIRDVLSGPVCIDVKAIQRISRLAYRNRAELREDYQCLLAHEDIFGPAMQPHALHSLHRIASFL